VHLYLANETAFTEVAAGLTCKGSTIQQIFGEVVTYAAQGDSVFGALIGRVEVRKVGFIPVLILDTFDSLIWWNY
jgi:hypothetical protein